MYHDCNSKSCEIYVNRCFNEYSKLNKNKARDGSSVLSTFLDANFKLHERSSNSACKSVTRVPESTRLLCGSGDAVETAMDISMTIAAENKSLKTKQRDMKKVIGKLKAVAIKERSQCETLSELTVNMKENLNVSRQEIKRVKRREGYWKNKCDKLEAETATSKAALTDITIDKDAKIAQLEETLANERAQTAYFEHEIEVLQDALQRQADPMVEVFDPKTNRFKAEMQTCVYNLLQHHVPSRQIGNMLT